MKKFLLSIMSLSMFFSPVQILANEEEVVEDVVVEEETVVEDEVVVDYQEEVVVDEEEIIETEDDYTAVVTEDGLGRWVQVGSKWKFRYETGKYATDEFLTIRGYNYYFDANGYMKTGWLKYLYYDGHYVWFYYESNGHQTSGWKQINGKWYYFNPEYENIMMCSDWSLISGYDYYFNESGVMQTGWIKYYDHWYYCASNGRELFGWQKINNKWYYFDPEHDGAMVNDTAYIIDEKAYYFLSNGAMATGFIEEDGVYCLFDQNGQLVANGWFKFDNKWYYVEYYDPVVDDLREINGYRYYFNDKGQMVTGWYFSNKYDSWFYFDEKGHQVSGWKQLNGKWYYFDPYYDNMMAHSNIWYISGYSYYFNESGVMQTGWIKCFGSWYYCASNGKTVQGWQKINNKWYYFDPELDSTMAQDITLTIDGVKYQFDSHGQYTKI